MQDLPQMKNSSITKDISKSLIGERKRLNTYNTKTDSIIITQYDEDNKEIDTVVIKNKWQSPIEDTNIPDEDNKETASSYVLPPKQYNRSISVKNDEKSRRPKRSSWGPKLHFENKIVHKSRSRSKFREALPPSGRTK